MQIDKALQVRQQCESNLRCLFSEAKHFGFTHTEMQKRKQEWLNRGGADKAPRWVAAYLSGYWNALMDNAYASDLVYGAMIDGVFYSTHSNRPDYYERHGIDARRFANPNATKGHYWADSLKPFFVSPD